MWCQRRKRQKSAQAFPVFLFLQPLLRTAAVAALLQHLAAGLSSHHLTPLGIDIRGTRQGSPLQMILRISHIHLVILLGLRRDLEANALHELVILLRGERGSNRHVITHHVIRRSAHIIVLRALGIVRHVVVSTRLWLLWRSRTALSRASLSLVAAGDVVSPSTVRSRVVDVQLLEALFDELGLDVLCLEIPAGPPGAALLLELLEDFEVAVFFDYPVCAPECCFLHGVLLLVSGLLCKVFRGL